MPYIPNLIPDESKIIPEYFTKRAQVIKPKSAYLTNKSLAFEGNIKNPTRPNDRIRSISQRPEGILIQKDKGKDPVPQLTGDGRSIPCYF
jgi:hypothetical protein